MSGPRVEQLLEKGNDVLVALIVTLVVYVVWIIFRYRY